MKRKLILLAFITVPFLTPISASAEVAQLKVKRDSTTILTLRISDKSLNFFCDNPAQLTAVLRDHGVDCCSSQTRVSETVWKCCHGDLSIISSSARLQSVLDAAFSGQKFCQR